MGIFSDEAFRLLQTKWGDDADLLAQELYAIFRSDGLKIDGPVEINNPTEDPAITIIPKTKDDSTDIQKKDSTGNPKDEEASSPGGIPAKIVSGTNDTYVVDLYQNGVEANKTARVTAKCVQIATGETIPVATWVSVTKFSDAARAAGKNDLPILSPPPSQYVFLIPVWM